MTQFVPSATITTRGSVPALRRCCEQIEPLAHLATATRVDLEPHAREPVGCAQHHRVADRERRAAVRGLAVGADVLPGVAGQRRPGREDEHRRRGRYGAPQPRRSGLRPDDLSHSRVRDLLPGGAGPLVGADAATRGCGSRSSWSPATSSTARPDGSSASCWRRSRSATRRRRSSLMRTDGRRCAKRSSSSRWCSTSACLASSSTTASSRLRSMTCSTRRPRASRRRSSRSPCRSASSFFTFQAISYIGRRLPRHDRRRRASSTSPLYLAFFPHLVAGPIVRAREFLPQLATPRDPRDVAVGAAIALIALGLVKKVAIADFLARTVVDPVFAVPQAYSAPDVAARRRTATPRRSSATSPATPTSRSALALLMGFVFPQNFHRPYRAPSFREFWRRWHMTLSRFLRDYLYIPLGGNRGGKLLHRPQPDDHDAARRAVARRGVDLRAVGRAPRRRARRSSTPLGGRIAPPRWLRWFVTFHVVVLALDPRSARPDLDLAGAFARAARSPGARHAVDAARRAGGRAASSACSSLPARPIDACACASRRCNPVAARRRAGGGHPGRRRDGAQPGRATLHLLPVLTSSPHDRPAPSSPRTGCALGARDAILAVVVDRGRARARRRAVDPRARARRWTPGSSAPSCWRSASRPGGSPTGCRLPTA